MKTVNFLATLVAVCLFLTLGGCYALTGCPGSAQCDPSYVASDADGSVYGGDSSSSPETKVDVGGGSFSDGNTDQSVGNEGCLPYKWMESSGEWTCEKVSHLPKDPVPKCTMKLGNWGNPPSYIGKWCGYQLICQNGTFDENLHGIVKASYTPDDFLKSFFSADHKTLYKMGCGDSCSKPIPIVYCTQ